MQCPKLAKTLLCGLVLALATPLAMAGEGKSESDYYNEELEARLDEARKQLDEAAKRLAEIHEQSFENNRQAYGQAYAALNFTQRAMLGVLLDGVGDGVALVGVTPGSGAADAGLKSGDKLIVIGETRLDGEDGYDALSNYMKSVKPGESVALQYARDGELHDAVVITQTRSDHMAYILDERFGNFGGDFSFDFNRGDFGQMRHRILTGKGPRLTDLDENLGDYFGVDAGVLVLEAPEDSELKSGDVLLRLDGEVPQSARDARRTIARADSAIEAEIMRKKRERTVSLAPRSFVLGGLSGGNHVKIIRLQRDGDHDIDIEVIVDED